MSKKIKNTLKNLLFWIFKNMTLGAIQKSWTSCFFLSKIFVLGDVFGFFLQTHNLVMCLKIQTLQGFVLTLVNSTLEPNYTHFLLLLELTNCTFGILGEFWIGIVFFSSPITIHNVCKYLGYPKMFPFCDYQLHGKLCWIFTSTWQSKPRCHKLTAVSHS